jgi:hypothetical protein
VLGDLPDRLTALEEQEAPEGVDISPLEEAVAALKMKMNSLQEAATDGAVEDLDGTLDPDEPEYRIFSYIEDKTEQGKVVELVAETLDKDMSYAQVIAHLEKSLSGETAKAISEHPSLTKEYIRYCRNKYQ